MTHAQSPASRGSDPSVGIDIGRGLRAAAARQPRAGRRSGATARRAVGHPAAVDGRRDFRYFVDAQGRQHFNFPQRIWRHRSIPMAMTPVMTRALETLAINLLAQAVPARNGIADGVGSRRMVALARRFCVQCLLTGSPAGWVIPLGTIEAWLASQPRSDRS
jgi:hypothetical protein